MNEQRFVEFKVCIYREMFISVESHFPLQIILFIYYTSLISTLPKISTIEQFVCVTYSVDMMKAVDLTLLLFISSTCNMSCQKRGFRRSGSFVLGLWFALIKLSILKIISIVTIFQQ